MNYLKGYKRLRRVKMLCTHQLTFPNGKVVKVTNDKLRKIRDKMNSRVKANQLSTASEDHIVTLDAKGNPITKPSSKINLLGYQMNYDIVKEGKNEWLVGDVYASPDKYETIKNLPFTSVEVDYSSDLISNIAFTKHRPQLDVGVITPYHWERGTVEHTGYAADRLVAYSVEGKQGGIVIYSSERSAMSQPTLTDFMNGLKELITKFDAPAEVVVETTPAPVVKTLPYSAVAAPDVQVDDAATELRKLKLRNRFIELGKTKKLNVDEEVKAWEPETDEVIEKHFACATACYASINAGGAKVTPLDGVGAGGAGVELKAKAQMILQKHADRGQHANMGQVLAKLQDNPAWNGD